MSYTSLVTIVSVHSGVLTNLGYSSQRDLIRQKFVCGGAEFSDFLMTEYMYPSLWIVGIILGLPNSFSGDLFGKI